MRFDYTIELRNEDGEMRRQHYNDGDEENAQIVALGKVAVLVAVAATADASWELDSIICEPVTEEVLEDHGVIEAA